MHPLVGRVLLWLEGLLAIGWIVLMSFGHADGNLHYRTYIFFFLFHFIFVVPPLAYSSYIYNVHEHPHTGYRWSYLGFFVFAVVVDINNLLETVLHLPRSFDLWYGMIVMTSVALAWSSFALIWYFTLVWKHGTKIVIAIPKTLLEPFVKTPYRSGLKN